MAEETVRQNEETELGITFHTKAPEPAASAPADKKQKDVIDEMAATAEVAKKAGVFDVSKAESAEHELGTIVTDRKLHRATLGESMQSAFGEWWHNLRTSAKPVIENLKKPDVGPTVAKVETRVDVIENAAKHATFAPKDDHHAVVEKIKTFKRDVARATGAAFVVKEERRTEDGAPRWTHTLDERKQPALKREPHPDLAPDLRKTMVAPVVEKRIKKDPSDYAKRPKTQPSILRKSASPTEVAFMHIPGTVERKNIPKPTPAQIAPVVRGGAKEEPTIHEASPTREQVGYVAREEVKRAAAHVEPPAIPVFGAEALSPKKGLDTTPAPPFHAGTPVSQNVEASAEPAAPKKSSRVYTTPSTSWYESHARLTWSVASGVLVVAAVLFIVLRSGGPSPAANPTPGEGGTGTVPAVTSVPSFFDVDAAVPIALTDDRSGFFGALQSAVASAQTGVTQFYPTITEVGVTRVAGSAEIFTTLGLSLPASATRSLDPVIMFGSVTVAKNEPFVVLRGKNFDSLFAGLLAWEPRLRSDLSPLFDTSYVERDVFEDAVKQGRAARVLHDALGSEVLLYTFVDDTTVVITSSEEALTKVMARL